MAADPLSEEVQRKYEQCFAESESLLEAGDSQAKLYFIRAGEVELSGIGWLAEKQRLGPGDVFGEFSTFLGQPFPGQAVALAECRALVVDAETCEEMCREQPGIALRLFQQLGKRLAMLQQERVQRERRQVRAVAQALWQRWEPSQDAGSAPQSLREIAQEAGLSLFETYAVFRYLCERRILSLAESGLALQQRKRLRDLAEGKSA